MAQAQFVKSASEKLANDNTGKNLIIGFDGFVDEITHVVEERQAIDKYTKVETIGDFAKKIAAAAGLSANIEFFPIQTKLGGNGPILANALALQNHKISYIGALGDPTIDPVFADFAKCCKKVITMANPGHADALEFDDGKIICGKTASLPAVNWENLLKLVCENELREMASNSALLGFTNWMELPNFNSLLLGFNKILAQTKNRPAVFIDLADPARRPVEEIKEVCGLIEKLQENADVIFGLNESESRQIAAVYGINEDDFSKRASGIQNKSGLCAVVIHPLAGAAVATKDGSWWIDGPYTKKPKLTTGAGDNFNAGFCNGWLSGLTPQECLCSGVCTSGFYVRNCRSPKRSEVVEFMAKWSDIDCGEI
jgi:sugar/nucleoside kinase (ribokinase family)